VADDGLRNYVWSHNFGSADWDQSRIRGTNRLVRSRGSEKGNYASFHQTFEAQLGGGLAHLDRSKTPLNQQ
jgi:hypothetical protein